MNKPTTPENNFNTSQHLSLLHSLKNLMEDPDMGEQDKSKVRQAVKDVIKKRDDATTIIVGLRPLLARYAINSFKSKNYKMAKSAMSLLRTESNGNP